MTPGLIPHATIALLASSCALDFSWPLDLVTTCETDAHCPEGLVCRFNSCGRDAVGKDGEPCNLAGRCEEGLLCDEIVCRPSRNNEPVPVWARAVESVKPIDDSRLQASPQGPWWYGRVVGPRDRAGIPLTPLAGSVDGLLELVTRWSEDGSDPMAFSASGLGFSVAGSTSSLGVVANSADGTLLLAQGDNGFDDFSFLDRVHLLRLAPGSNRLELVGVRRGATDVRYVGHATSTEERGYLAYAVSASADEDEPGRLVVEELDGTGAEKARWSFGPATTGTLASAPNFQSFGDASAGPPLLLVSGASEFFGLGEDTDRVVALYRLEAGGSARRLVAFAGGEVITTGMTTLPDGSAFACLGISGTVDVYAFDAVTPVPLAAADEADLALVRLSSTGELSQAVLHREGLQTSNSCTTVGGRVVLSGTTVGAWPPGPEDRTARLDQDLLLATIDPESLELVHAFRHGDRGPQNGLDVVASGSDGFIVLASFGSGLNLGLGRFESVSGGDALIARYRLPAP